MSVCNEQCEWMCAPAGVAVRERGVEVVPAGAEVVSA